MQESASQPHRPRAIRYSLEAPSLAVSFTHTNDFLGRSRKGGVTLGCVPGGGRVGPQGAPPSALLHVPTHRGGDPQESSPAGSAPAYLWHGDIQTDTSHTVLSRPHRTFSSAASLVAQTVKNLPAMQESQLRSLDQEDPLEKKIATHSSILTWRIPWTEEPGRLKSMESQRVRHD